VIRYLYTLCVSAIIASSSVASELTIEITRGLNDALSIAVVPFHWDGAQRVPDDVAHIVASDLERSGQFKPLGKGDMISLPHRAEDVFWHEWRALKIDYLVIGRVALKDDRYHLYFELYDVYAGTRLEAGDVKAGHIRDAAHYASDVIYEKLTGQRGAFSTKLLYVTVEHVVNCERKNEQLYRLKMADADGFRDVTILESSEPVMSPDWSPDGKHVAYVSFQNKRPAIYIQNTETGQQQQVTNFPRINGAPSFSPDGRKLAMALSKDGNLDVFVLDIASQTLTRVTKHYRADTEPSWFPDGQSLLFTSDRAGQPQIYKVALATGKVDRVTFEGRYNARGELTRDGRQLVMVSGDGRRFYISVQDLVDGSVRIITDTALDESPSVAPNGSMVIYATQDKGRSVLAAVSMDGKVKVRLPSSRGGVREPAWSPYLR